MDLSSGFHIASIEVEPNNGLVRRGGATVELEPKVMDLLCLLARAEGETVTREEIAEQLWSGQIVNEDALARTVFKLRKALDDDARDPRFIATVPKRGYRLLVQPEMPSAPAPSPHTHLDWHQRYRGLIAGGVVALIMLAIASLLMLSPDGDGEDSSALALIERADDFYAQIDEADNASAMRLYERALALEPDQPQAHAGLSNALVQTVIRWSPGDWPEIGETSRIQTALANGRTRTEVAQRQLDRALGHAQRAVELDPGYALGYRALGLVLSARGEIEPAIEAYSRAVTIEPDSWEALINLSDLSGYRGEAGLALRYMEQAFEAMSRVYDEQAVRIRPWYSQTGLSIAADHLALGAGEEAERWYRRVLHWDPLNAEALEGLAAQLFARGDIIAARETCALLPDETAITACLGD